MRDSVWFRTLEPDQAQFLNQSDDPPSRSEVMVVGAGLIGLSTAFHLVERGVRDVTVVDRGPILSEASGANAGGIWPAHELLKLGELKAPVRASVALYDKLAERFDFDRTREGALELICGEEEMRRAADRVSDLRAAGCPAELLDAARTRGAEPLLRDGVDGAILLPREGQLHPAKLAAAWVRRIREVGGRVCGGVEVLEAGNPLTTSQGRIDAARVVIAAGAWTPLLTAATGWRPPIRPIRGTLLALGARAPGELRRTVHGPRYYWWQLPSGHIVGGGSEEEVGFEREGDEEARRSIRDELESLFPSLASEPTFCAWNGLRPFCADEAPVIGAVPERGDLWVAAGHFRRGVLMAPITGKIVADLILDGASPDWVSAFSPARFERASALNS